MDRQKNERLQYIFWIFLPILINFAIQLYIGMVESGYFTLKAISQYDGGGYEGLLEKVAQLALSQEANNITYMSYPIAALLIFIPIYFKKFREDKRPIIKGASDYLPATMAGIVLFTIGAQYACTYIMSAVGTAVPSWLQEYEELIETAGIGNDMSIIMGVYAVVLAPILEELTFRGITMKAASKVMPAYAAIIVQALLFGAYHMNPLQGIYAFALGAGLGYVMYRYDNLLITICIHMLFNMIGSFGVDFLPMGGDTLLSFFMWTLGSLIITYLGILLLSKGAPRVNISKESADI
ncbi:MAG: CPBP family intramembrane metalloprotease [Pseudobutyrivibrio sp.]|nr:CPBP family intramembrane metalloprotease [Pseudobutyrivibrio sp.]